MKVDEYRDLLEQWVEWWNNVGRYHFTSNIIPPISTTGEALKCMACAGVGEIEGVGERCQVCAKEL